MFNNLKVQVFGNIYYFDSHIHGQMRILRECSCTFLQKWPEQQLHSQSKLCSLITEWGTDVMESCKLQTIVTTTVPGMQWPCFTFYIYSFLPLVILLISWMLAALHNDCSNSVSDRISDLYPSFLLNTESNVGEFILSLKCFQSETWNNLASISLKDTIH